MAIGCAGGRGAAIGARRSGVFFSFVFSSFQFWRESRIVDSKIIFAKIAIQMAAPRAVIETAQRHLATAIGLK